MVTAAAQYDVLQLHCMCVNRTVTVSNTTATKSPAPHMALFARSNSAPSGLGVFRNITPNHHPKSKICPLNLPSNADRVCRNHVQNRDVKGVLSQLHNSQHYGAMCTVSLEPAHAMCSKRRKGAEHQSPSAPFPCHPKPYCSCPNPPETALQIVMMVSRR